MLEIILVCALLNGIAFIFSPSGMETGQYYNCLVKPAFAPPSSIFGIVWPILYTAMGYASYRVYQQINVQNAAVNRAFIIFIAQFILNIIWSPVFFGQKDFVYGSLIIALLGPMIAWSVVEFYNIDNIAGYLLVPYLLWVAFATGLSFEVLRLNYCAPCTKVSCCDCTPQES